MSRSSKSLAQRHHLTMHNHREAMKCYLNELPKIYGKENRRKTKEKNCSNFGNGDDRKTASISISMFRSTTGRPFLSLKQELSGVVEAISASSWTLYNSRTNIRSGSK